MSQNVPRRHICLTWSLPKGIMMLQPTLLLVLLSTLRSRRHAHRDESGSISVEQVVITAGLVAVTVIALAAITAGVQKYAGRI